MILADISPKQRGYYEAVLAELDSIGYCGELLQRDYAIQDWFGRRGERLCQSGI